MNTSMNSTSGQTDKSQNATTRRTFLKKTGAVLGFGVGASLLTPRAFAVDPYHTGPCSWANGECSMYTAIAGTPIHNVYCTAGPTVCHVVVFTDGLSHSNADAQACAGDTRSDNYDGPTYCTWTPIP